MSESACEPERDQVALAITSTNERHIVMPREALWVAVADPYVGLA